MSWGLVDLWFPGETDRTEELNRKNAELNRRKVEAGTMTPAQAEEQQYRFEDPTRDVNGQIFDDAVEGAAEGLQAIPDNIRNGLNTVAGWSFRAIPWWLWLGGVLALLVYMGGWARLRNILVKS